MGLTQVHNIYLEFLDYLNAADVRYAILHGWEFLAQGEPSDIDIIVAADDLAKLETSLRTRYRILNLFHYEASSFGFVLSPKDHDLSSLFVADLSTDYRWRGRIFFTDQEFLQDRQQWRDYWVTGPAQEFAYLLVKKIYEKGAIPEHQRIRIRQLARELGPGAHPVVSRLFGTVWGSRLIHWIVHEQWIHVVAHIPQLRRCLRWQVLKRDYLNPLRYWLAEVRRCWVRWTYLTGVSIAVLGPEGARKTLLSDLQAVLPKVFRRIAILGRAPSLIECKKSSVVGSDCNARLPRPTWISRFNHLLDYGLPFIFRVRPLLVRSTLVLFELYNKDLLLDGYVEGIRYIRFAHNLVPSPDLLFIVSPHDSNLSAPEQRVSKEELGQGCEPHMQIPLERPKAVLLDGRLPAEGIARCACDVLSDYLSKRYSERRHVWFPSETCETLH